MLSHYQLYPHFSASVQTTDHCAVVRVITRQLTSNLYALIRLKNDPPRTKLRYGIIFFTEKIIRPGLFLRPRTNLFRNLKVLMAIIHTQIDYVPIYKWNFI